MIVGNAGIVGFEGNIKLERLARVRLDYLIFLNILRDELVLASSVKTWVENGVDIDNNVFGANIAHIDIDTELFPILRDRWIQRNVWTKSM